MDRDPDFSVRTMRRGDVAGLLTTLSPVLAASYPGGADWLAERLARACAGLADATVAVEPNGRLVALCVAQAKPRGVKLSCYWVDPAWRHLGVGTALAERMVASYGARPMYLTCDEGVGTAFEPLLAGVGFTLTAVMAGRYRPGRTEMVLSRVPDPEPAVRALSLTRPWSELIFSGKDVENRSWKTNFRGLVVIHGAKSTTSLASTFCRVSQLPAPAHPGECPTGFLGVAHLVGIDCHDVDCGLRCSNWAMGGSWHWRLRFPVRFAEPIPGRGFVRLWTPPADVVAAALDVVKVRGGNKPAL